MEQRPGYALKGGEGWVYNLGIDFTVKAGEVGPGRRVALNCWTGGSVLN